MRLIFWFDAKLLALTQRFVDKFNWLTGKDNFWLAKQFAFIAPILSYLSLTLLWIGKVPFPWLLLPLPVLFICSLCLIQLVKFEEERSTLLQLRGIKLDQSRVRISIDLIFIALQIPKQMKGFEALEIVSTFIWIMVWYLATTDRPRYNKSRFREWLKKPQTRLVPSEVQT